MRKANDPKFLAAEAQDASRTQGKGKPSGPPTAATPTLAENPPVESPAESVPNEPNPTTPLVDPEKLPSLSPAVQGGDAAAPAATRAREFPSAPSTPQGFKPSEADESRGFMPDPEPSDQFHLEVNDDAE